MSHTSIIVRATWDEEARVWVATSTDIAGLVVEADSLEALKDRVTGAIADLLDANGYSGGLTEIPVHLMADQLLRVAAPVAA
ncbi:MAG: DUF1902 domain-containing protein [Cypionkella sp.]|uniref:DUF1902 domain-containing protein n=1 Tax=Cypionkella sp. TaxID=2811411 RepID=UPI00272F520C|nr:DUF1902 domain-containing protein [Cypionkella sp.]MDP2051941.1 DUF1902 domain-containing protein [Cypionkella sp.]